MAVLFLLLLERGKSDDDDRFWTVGVLFGI